MSGVWEREINGLVQEQAQRVRYDSAIVKVRRARVRSALKELAAAEDELLESMKSFEEKCKTLVGRRHDPEVVVRNYNKTTLYTYHADTRCGWVKHPSRTERILLSEAKELGYSACVSCGSRVPKLALASD